jgi:hypothetical protein
MSYRLFHTLREHYDNLSLSSMICMVNLQYLFRHEVLSELNRCHYELQEQIVHILVKHTESDE